VYTNRVGIKEHYNKISKNIIHFFDLHKIVNYMCRKFSCAKVDKNAIWQVTV